MKKELFELLICPNTGAAGFTCFATVVNRDGQTLHQIPNDELRPDDNIMGGLLMSDDQKFVAPIRFGVLSLLSDEDIDVQEFKEHLDTILPDCPDSYAEVAHSHLARLQSTECSSDGEWNREEMKYYDEAVSTPEKRSAMCADIVKKDLPHIFLPREKHILGPLKDQIKGKTVIEIGCGNARTIVRLMPPEQHAYRYVGTDIAFWRLVVAQEACPGGQFIQASAFNLPFASECADVGVSFGMLHHLPRPADGLVELHRTLKSDAVLGFHEPVVTKKIVAGRFDGLTSALETYDHSDHDGEIDFTQFAEHLDGLGYSVMRKEFMVSPFRTVLQTILGRISPGLLRSRVVCKAAGFMDRICIQTVCRVSQLLAPRSVIVLANRKPS